MAAFERGHKGPDLSVSTDVTAGGVNAPLQRNTVPLEDVIFMLLLLEFVYCVAPSDVAVLSFAILLASHSSSQCPECMSHTHTHTHAPFRTLSCHRIKKNNQKIK